jgi:glycogen debranching enzyme
MPWASSASATLGGTDREVVTLVEGTAFAISLPSGDMLPGAPHGLFYLDTRFLSELRLRVNGQWPEPLSSTMTDPFSAAFVLRNQPLPGLADSHLVVFRNRYVGLGMREDVSVRNYGLEPAFCALELLVDADFADLFEVKESRVEPVGERAVNVAGSRVSWSYRRGHFARGAHLDFAGDPELSTSNARYEVLVPAGGEWTTCLQLTPVIDDEELTPRYRCGRPVERATPVARLEEWRRSLPTIRTDNEGFTAVLDRSTEDLAALRLFDAEHPERTVVAAGAPWFMTLFGRDSLLTSWMTLLVNSELALGTLQTLARFQGEDVNPLTEEEPGRILHEMRFGEASELSLGGGRIYYGSVDATPLFVMLLGELWRWRDDPEEIDALLPAADRALRWIDEFGDRDDDGYVEYLRTSDRGLRNQGWKDSHDAIRFADGRLAEPPIALCEVQGYVYAAQVTRARIAAEHGQSDVAQRLDARAAELKRRFNEDFWLDEHDWLAMGLDRDKQPIDALASNMGHCLWTGILDDDKAAIVAARLGAAEMFSGWGVRTLGTTMTGYNPLSYHNGSVWPHDNALCAAGLVRYGMVEQAHRVMGGIVGSAAYFGNRLPELFAGFTADEVPFPVRYPTSCSPQAWAAATPLLFLRTMLGFEPDVRDRQLRVAPAVPDWVGRLTLERVPLMGGRLSIEVHAGTCTVGDVPEGLEVVIGG